MSYGKVQVCEIIEILRVRLKFYGHSSKEYANGERLCLRHKKEKFLTTVELFLLTLHSKNKRFQWATTHTQTLYTLIYSVGTLTWQLPASALVHFPPKLDIGMFLNLKKTQPESTLVQNNNQILDEYEWIWLTMSVLI